MSAEQDSLPAGWASSTLGDLAVRVTKGTTPTTLGFSYQEAGIRFVKVESLKGGVIDHALCAFVDAETHAALERSQLQEGDVLISIAGTLGRIAVVRGLDVPANTNQALAIVRLAGAASPLYVARGLEAFTGAAKAGGRGVGLQNLNLEQIRGLEIPVAPLNEQKRIVAKIEALQARSDAAKEALDAIPPLLEKFRQSVLAAAFRGDLTKKWREAHPDVEPASKLLERIRAERRRRWEEANPKKKYVEPERPDVSHGTPLLPATWAVASVGEVSDCLDRHRRPVTRRDRRPGPFPYYGANGQVDSVSEYLFDGELVLVTEDETFYGRTKPIAYRVSGKCWVNNHAHVLQAVDPVPHDYLAQSLMHYPVIPWLSGTTGRAKLTQGALNVLPIAIAPAEEMACLAATVADLLAFADSVAEATALHAEPLRLLNQSILAKAFRGELVPQDPNDEPAAVLLERIRTARNASSREAEKRRRPRPPAAGDEPCS